MYLLLCDGNKNAYSLQSSACNTMHGMACSASRCSICRETMSDHTTCSPGDVTQAGLQAEQHRPAACLPAQACSRHASDCRCSLCCTSRGKQAYWSVSVEMSAGSSCSGSRASGEETAYCRFQDCICQRSMAEHACNQRHPWSDSLLQLNILESSLVSTLMFIAWLQAAIQSPVYSLQLFVGCHPCHSKLLHGH